MTLSINDLFFTVQGEGCNVGRSALFVRMPFCNLKCSWCDTSFNSFKETAPEDFVRFAKSQPTRFAVITGGEPTMHKHTPKVIALLKDIGYRLAIETNGNFPIPAGIDWVCVSPKRDAQYRIDPDAFGKADEFKYVVDDGFDFSILHRHDLPSKAALWLSPEFGNMKANVETILDYIKTDPRWRLNLQTHKLIGVP